MTDICKRPLEREVVRGGTRQKVKSSKTLIDGGFHCHSLYDLKVGRVTFVAYAFTLYLIHEPPQAVECKQINKPVKLLLLVNEGHRRGIVYQTNRL